MPTLLRVALVGCGLISDAHCAAYAAYPERAKITTCYDISTEKAAARAASLGGARVAGAGRSEGERGAFGGRHVGDRGIVRVCSRDEHRRATGGEHPGPGDELRPQGIERAAGIGPSLRYCLEFLD